MSLSLIVGSGDTLNHTTRSIKLEVVESRIQRYLDQELCATTYTNRATEQNTYGRDQCSRNSDWQVRKLYQKVSLSIHLASSKCFIDVHLF
jgi:hypothetical protein